MSNFADDLDALRRAQPTWVADGLGVRGNPVEFQKQQAPVDWPPAQLNYRSGGVHSGPTSPGSPSQPPSVPAT